LRKLSAEKFIPRTYLRGSVAQRKLLLAGLMDGDGTVRLNRTTFCTRSPFLARDIKELVSSLGGIAKIRTYLRDSGVDYQVNIKTLFCPFRCARKSALWSPPGRDHHPCRTIVRVERLPDMQETICISVDAPDKLFLCGDDYVVTHNTIQAIGFINWLRRKCSVLVVCPASLKLNWQVEMRKWLLIPHSSAVCAGRTGDLPSTDAIIINPDILAARLEQLAARQWDVIIADECHYFKGAKTKRTKGFLALKAPYRLALTGTPILNRPIEIQTVLQWLAPMTWGNRWKFAERYCNLTQGRFGVDMSGASNLSELNVKLRSTVMVRRLKKDVLTELPPKFRQVIELPAEGEQPLIEQEWQAYRTMEATTQALRLALHLAKASEHDSEYHAAVAALRDGQSAAFQEMARMRVEVAQAKIPYVITHLQDCVADHRVVVFGHHHIMLDAIRSAFPASAMITGKTPNEQRQAEVVRFQTANDCPLFIGGIKAAGIGITLTASSHVVFSEIDWTPAWMSQCEDRCHRIGQRDNVLVQHLVLEGSLDAVMAKRIIEKQRIIDQALDAQADPNDMVEEIMVAADEGDSAVAKVTRKQVVVEAKAMTPEAMHIAHVAVRYIAALCDHALSRDAVGFGKFDAEIGAKLAALPMLSPRQAVLAAKLARRYRKQLPEQLAEQVSAMFKEPGE
jgi:SWI/SNF-related matrix-associated actin-dependent regulator 1 of chromatin subfamily A